MKVRIYGHQYIRAESGKGTTWATQHDVASALETVVGNYANKENWHKRMTVEEVTQIENLLALSEAEIMGIF